MRFDAPYNWFTAEGMPITPYDDAGKKNYYPLTYIIARDTAGKELGRTRIVTPVSDELDCRGCHASGSANTARPNAGWAFLPDPERDYKMNVLRLHDERNAGSPVYQNALVKLGFDAKGLEATVASRPLLCASCHSSNALPGTGTCRHYADDPSHSQAPRAGTGSKDQRHSGCGQQPDGLLHVPSRV